MITTNVIDKIIETSKILNELDEYKDSLPTLLSNVDSKLSDLYHLIENNSLKTNQCYRVVKEIKKLRIERRKIKNDMELFKTYESDNSKLLNYEYRKFLLNNIKLTNKKLQSTYKNRVYTEEEITQLLG